MNDNGTKIIGFRGMEAADIIFYMSRVIVNLDYKVIIYDLSPADELEHFCPNGMGIDLKKDILDYRGVHYTKKDMEKKEADQYDAVFVNFGYLAHSKHFNDCGSMLYVTDMSKSCIDRLLLLKSSSCIEQRLLLRDIIKNGLGMSVYVNELKERFHISKIDKLKINLKDIKACQCMQYNDRYRFNNISRAMHNLIIDYVEFFILSGEECSQLLKAVRKAMKGG